MPRKWILATVLIAAAPAFLATAGEERRVVMDDFLSSLASGTGGNYTAQATDFARILADIEQSNRLWYELILDLPGAGSPGPYQHHEVRVRNRPSLEVVVLPGHVVPY